MPLAITLVNLVRSIGTDIKIIYGKLKLATNAEAINGTNATALLTPQTLAVVLNDKFPPIGREPNHLVMHMHLGRLAYRDVVVVEAPTSSTSLGIPGQIAFDVSYLYVCVAPDSWKRIALTTW